MSAREIYLRHGSRHSTNVVTRLSQGQSLTGMASQSLAFLPSSIPSRCRLEDKGIYKLFVPLLRHFRQKPVYNDRKLAHTFKRLLAKLPFPTSNGVDVPASVRTGFHPLSRSRARVGVFGFGRLDERNEEQNSRNIRSVNKFLEHNEAFLVELREVLFRPVTANIGLNRRRGLQLKKGVLKVLIRLYLLQPESNREFFEETEQRELVQFCFASLNNEMIFEEATELLEMILMRQDGTFNLCSVPNLVEGVLEKLEGRKLARFCRLLAVTISDLDMYENKASLFAQNKQKRAFNYVPVRDLNQELVLRAKGLLSRLIHLGCNQDYYPRYINTTFEIDNWMDFIDNQISVELGLPVSASQSVSNLGEQPAKQDIANAIVDRVEALYVLSLLMVGKHRKQVQQETASLQLIPQMSNLLDSFIWRPNPPAQRGIWGLPGHNHTCECSPEVAAKIQFLRLVHSFCDHSQHKHLLLTPYEFGELKRIGQDPLLPGTKFAKEKLTVRPDENLMCSGSKGLLTKIVDILIKEKHSSTFRFWLCRAIESYLRGSQGYEDQIFLIRRGLLKHITLSLLSLEPRQREVIQSSFDLLGELTKFNLDACHQMDLLLNSETKLKKGMRIIFVNLVDSNMFVRAMILAADHFLSNDCDAETVTTSSSSSSSENTRLSFVKNSKLMGLFRDFEQHLMFIIRLIKIIDVKNLTQENISCLNTALVIIMLNRRMKRLAQLLQALSDHQADSSSNDLSGRELLSNFKELCIFWEDHYLHKDKDSSQLERSSRIKFDYWRSTVRALIAPPSTLNDISIANFLAPAECSSVVTRSSD